MSLSAAIPLFRLFVYGTLKRAYYNHPKYLSGYSSVEESSIVGRLFIREGGIPMLEVPRGNVLAFGSSDPMKDLETQTRIAGELPPNLDLSQEADASKGWHRVKGELFTFRDVEVRLRHLDDLEDFYPGSAACRYDRVLSPVGRGNGSVAWVYVISDAYPRERLVKASNPEVWDLEREKAHYGERVQGAEFRVQGE